MQNISKRLNYCKQHQGAEFNEFSSYGFYGMLLRRGLLKFRQLVTG